MENGQTPEVEGMEGLPTIQTDLGASADAQEPERDAQAEAPAKRSRGRPFKSKAQLQAEAAEREASGEPDRQETEEEMIERRARDVALSHLGHPASVEDRMTMLEQSAQATQHTLVSLAASQEGVAQSLAAITRLLVSGAFAQEPVPAAPVERPPAAQVDPSAPATNGRQKKAMRATHEHVAREYLGIPMEDEHYYYTIVPTNDPTVALQYELESGYEPVTGHKMYDRLNRVGIQQVMRIAKIKKQTGYTSFVHDMNKAIGNKKMAFGNPDDAGGERVRNIEDMESGDMGVTKNDVQAPATIKELVDRMPDSVADDETWNGADDFEDASDPLAILNG